MTITPVNTAHYEMVLPLDPVLYMKIEAILTALLVGWLPAQTMFHGHPLVSDDLSIH